MGREDLRHVLPGQPGKRDSGGPSQEPLQHRTVHSRVPGYETYCKFPSIPRFERNVLLIICGRKPELRLVWLFVLKDNSSEEALHAPLVTEDVEAAMDLIGVERKSVKWFDVRSRVNGACSLRVITIALKSSIDSVSRSL